MPRILGLFPSSLLAARNGMSANAYYRELRTLGLAARRSEVLALYKLSQSIVTTGGEEPFKDITQVPHGNELTPWPAKTATGVRQNITLVYRDRVTGTIKRTFYSASSEEGITREEAMARATNAYSDQAEAYGQDLIGAVHTGSYQYVPFAGS